MARKILTEKEKKKKRRKRLIVILFILLVLGGLGFVLYKYVYKAQHKTATEVKIVDSLDEYGYTLSDRDSDYYKSEFEKLKQILISSEVDEEAYATQVAKMFVIDLYTMSTKINKYDVGGNEFFYIDEDDNKKEMYEQKVMDTLYETMLDDTYSDREQDLPEVKEVIVNSTEKTTYKVGDEEKNGYLVKMTITYEEDMGYDDEASVVVVKEDSGRMSVVDFQPTLEPEYDEE